MPGPLAVHRSNGSGRIGRTARRRTVSEIFSDEDVRDSCMQVDYVELNRHCCWLKCEKGLETWPHHKGQF